MRAIEQPGRRSILRVLAVVVAVAAISAVVADGALAKKRLPYKSGSYTGMTSQGEPIGLSVKKRKVTVVYVDLRPPCYVPDPFLPPLSWAGLTGKIKVKKVGAIAFGKGRKRVGYFEVDAPGDSGFVLGWLKGRRAEGVAEHDYPGCPYDFDWEAKQGR